MKNKLLQLINSFTKKMRERITSSQDSPVSSCCPTLRQRIRQSLRNTWRKVSHRFATTGSQIHIFRGSQINQFMRSLKHIMANCQILYHEDCQMSFLQTKENLREFKDYLEKCLNASYSNSSSAEICELVVIKM
jgi:hypothetical protein